MEAGKGSAPLKAISPTEILEEPVSDVEKLLMSSIEEQTLKLMAVTTIMVKAQVYLWGWKKKAGPNYDTEFIASSGWFKWSKNHDSLHKVKVSGASVSADVKAAEEFLETT